MKSIDMQGLEWSAHCWSRPARKDGDRRAAISYPTEAKMLLELSVRWEYFEYCKETLLTATNLVFEKRDYRWVINNPMSKRMEVI